MSTPAPPDEPTLRVDSARTVPGAGPQSQLAPGTVIADRYRIVSPLGSGGMGDVYRADDLKLGQAVALKFLPPALARNPSLHEQLHDEVRLGRQISHPNVCRIYDIVDWDGSYFVAMEHVDGEDLARLLRRIGRLPHDKAIEIARGIAAGLAAAHSKGILHRDLKPANIMIDSHGEARIMDFGLALTHDAAETSGTAGTPAYMAPEQLIGRAASVRSDLYALGLVMYETFTGKRLYDGADISQLRLQQEREVAAPSIYIRDLDPNVERLILRCLNRDPQQRPGSAREVYEALPGGDALAAALAAGETPSPRLVAAAGSEGLLAPATAWALVAIAAVLLTTLVAVESVRELPTMVPFDKSPAVLAERAIEVANALGFPRQAFRWTGFESKPNYLVWLADRDRSPRRWSRLRRGPASLLFWMRQSPRPLTPVSKAPAATQDDPPLIESGMSTISIDTTGRLIGFEGRADINRSAPLDWKRVFALAGLDLQKFAVAAPRDAPALFSDSRAAWDGLHPDDGTPIHVEAASARGIPVYFRVVGAWDADVEAAHRMLFAGRGFALFEEFIFGLVALIGIMLAARNLRLRRGDRRGALRLSMLVFALNWLMFALRADHRIDVHHEVSLFVNGTAAALYWAFCFYVLYIALEPFVRRRWPDTLISWTRLLSGKASDPMVGRDVLVGVVAGLGHTTLATLTNWLPARLGWNPPVPPHVSNLRPLLGTRFALSHLPASLLTGIVGGVVLVMVLVTLTILVQRRAVAVGALLLLQIAVYSVALQGNPRIIPWGIAIATLVIFILVRFGLLATVMLHTVFGLTFQYPIALDPASWTVTTALVPIVAIAAILFWSFRIAVGDQPLFSGTLLAEE
jgi:serine/threonine-protein kinase